MRTTAIAVHNRDWIEIFVRAIEGGFELWTVATIKGRRVVLDHHITHDDVERRLHYQRKGDLQWRDALLSEVPTEKHSKAKEMEDTIKRGTFIDLESTFFHLGFGSIGLLPTDRRVLSAAKKAITGNWSDGQATMILAPDSKLALSGLGTEHQLNLGRNPNAPEPNWWNFAGWQLWLMNMDQKVGQRISVLRVDDQELHLHSDQLDCVAHVFKRVS